MKMSFHIPVEDFRKSFAERPRDRISYCVLPRRTCHFNIIFVRESRRSLFVDCHPNRVCKITRFSIFVCFERGRLRLRYFDAPASAKYKI